MKKTNQTIIFLIILIIYGCQKDELINSIAEDILPPELVELQNEYGVKITEESTSSISLAPLSLDQIKKRLSVFKALCQDTFFLKREIVKSNTMAKTVAQTPFYYKIKMYKGIEYAYTPGGENYPDTYIGLSFELLADFEKLSYNLNIKSISPEQILEYSFYDSYARLTYFRDSKVYDVTGKIGITYVFQSLDTDIYYCIHGSYTIYGFLDEDLAYISFNCESSWGNTM